MGFCSGEGSVAGSAEGWCKLLSGLLVASKSLFGVELLFAVVGAVLGFTVLNGSGAIVLRGYKRDLGFGK